MSRTHSTWRPVLLAGIALFILAATLKPFDFRFDPEFTAKRIRVVDWSPLPDPEHESLFIDTASNVVLFFPLGAAFSFRRRGGRESRVSILLATVSAGVLSAACETLQVWLPTRHPQVLDVVANTFGSLAGAVSAVAWNRVDALALPGEIRNGIRWNADSSLLLLLSALAVAHPLLLAFPDPVRSVKELEAHAKAFIRSPAAAWSTENAILPVILLGALSFRLAEWSMRSFPSLRHPSTYLPVLLLSSVVAILLPIPRIFFRPLSPDWGSILFGLLGVSLGLSIHRWRRFRALPGPPAP